MGYSGDILQILEVREDLRFIVTNEGSAVSIDNMVILKNAKNTDVVANSEILIDQGDDN